MSGRTWLLVLSVALVAAIATPFLGSSVPFCTRPVGGTVSAECIANWQAGWSVFERLHHTFGTPLASVITSLFVVLVAALAHVVTRMRRRAD